MDKLKMHSPDLSQDSIAKIRALFPDCVTEAADEHGKLRLAVDFDQLRQVLSDHIVEGPQERYRLDWPGKREALLTANAPIAKTLRPCREESVDFDTTQNLFIEGDNLDALKLLQESYLGKVKMIYIDPPYNTGSDFIYEDDFAENADEFLIRSNQKNSDGGRLVANTESNGRFHSDWLSMMFSRIKVARNLLKDDGFICVSIDDVEVANLRKIMDDIFGESCFIAEIIRNTNSSKNQSLFVSVSHEYCLVYAKNIETLKVKHSNSKWQVQKNNVSEYIKKVDFLRKSGLSNEEITEELKTLTQYPRFIDFTNYWYFDKRGLYRKGDLGGVKGGNEAPLFNPLTGKNDPVPPGGYRYNGEKLATLVKDERIHFHTDGSLPTIKRYLHENMGQRPKSIMSDDQRPDYFMLREFGTPFDNPKQLTFMNRLISLTDKDSIILDFFSGSATTGHATWAQNAVDGGNRTYLLVQLPEAVKEKADAHKAGFENIADVSKQRLRRAGKKVLDGPCHEGWNRDVGFRVLKIDSSNMTDVYYRPDEVKQDELFGQVDSVKPDRSGEDLLFQVLIDWGVELTLPITREVLHGKTVYSVDGNALIACFDSGVSDALIKDIAARAPLRAVFRDTSFARDADRINAQQLFRQLSPGTDLKAI